MIPGANRQTQNILYSIFLIYGLSWVAIDPLIPVIAEELRVGYDKMGIALFIGSAIMLLATFISGRLSDRYDIKKIIITGLSLLLFVFFIFGIYLNYFIFIIIMLLIRAGFGILDTSIHTFSSRLSDGKVSKIFINLNIFWHIGAIVAPLLISSTLLLNIRPKFVFLFLSLAYSIVLIVFYKICPARALNSKLQGKDIPKRSTITKIEFSSLRNPVVILCSLVMFFFLGAIAGFSTWFTTYFLAFEIKVSISSFLLSFYWLFATIGLYAMGRLAKRIKETKLLLWGYIIGIISLLIFALCPILYIKIIFLIIIAISFSGVYPLVVAISAQIDSKNTGTILGFVIAIAFSGSIVFQPIFGYIAEYFGENLVIFVVIGGMIISLIFFISLLQALKRKKL